MRAFSTATGFAFMPSGATALSSSLFCSCAYAKLMIAPVGERASTMGGVSPYTRILVILGITG